MLRAFRTIAILAITPPLLIAALIYTRAADHRWVLIPYALGVGIAGFLAIRTSGLRTTAQIAAFLTYLAVAAAATPVLALSLACEITRDCI